MTESELCAAYPDTVCAKYAQIGGLGMRILDDHSVVIVGGGSGLGRGIARRCLEEGAQLTVIEISPEKVQSLESEFGDRALLLQGDCTRLADLTRCRDEVARKFGKVDALICFQGIWDGNIPIRNIPAEKLDRLFDEVFGINVKGSLLAARIFCELLEESRGAIVLTSSNAAYAADGGGAAYTSSKGAVRSLIQQLAFEFAPFVRVNGVAPSAIANSELRGPASLGLERQKQSDIPKAAMLEMFRTLGLMSEIPQPEDYAIPYMFLASHQNSIMTGQTIVAEQGLLNRAILTRRET
jgi:cis-2,3-dihydrobiphenyl-2,3-diol dehydrogenase